MNFEFIIIKHRLKYKLTTGPVFPNLSTSSLGDALNLETLQNIQEDGGWKVLEFCRNCICS